MGKVFFIVGGRSAGRTQFIKDKYKNMVFDPFKEILGHRYSQGNFNQFEHYTPGTAFDKKKMVTLAKAEELMKRTEKFQIYETIIIWDDVNFMDLHEVMFRDFQTQKIERIIRFYKKRPE